MSVTDATRPSVEILKLFRFLNDLLFEKFVSLTTKPNLIKKLDLVASVFASVFSDRCSIILYFIFVVDVVVFERICDTVMIYVYIRMFHASLV